VRPCVVADAKLVTRLDTRHVVPGGRFVFKIVAHVAPSGDVPEIPAGAFGFGVIAVAEHARSNGQPGRVAFEPRFIGLRGDVRVPAIADPRMGENFLEGDSRNVPGGFAFIPLVGIAVGGYNALHRGREVVIEPGTPFRVVLGDDLALGRCADPSPSDAAL